MIGGTIGALRWGLPSGHPAASEPGLVPLTFQFLEFGDCLERTVSWTRFAVPEVVSGEDFARLVGSPGEVDRGGGDPWVARFVQLDAAMARLAGTRPLADRDDAYRRYTEWLPFAFRAEQITLAVSRDLDYQPVLVSDRPVSILHDADPLALASIGAVESEGGPPGPTRWWEHARRHIVQTDPGYDRLRAATRALLATAAAIATLLAIFGFTDHDAVEPAIFGGFVAMLCAGVPIDRTRRWGRWAGVLILVPIEIVLLLGARFSDSELLTGLLFVLVATLGAWAARFGRQGAALGRASFMTFYFALILRLEQSDVLLFSAAALIGVGWAYLVNLVVLPERPGVVLRSGLEGFTRRLETATTSLVDAVSWARWDVDVRKRVQLDLRQLDRHAAFLTGQLTRPAGASGVPADRATTLRLRLFDAELAASRLVATARDVTGTAISLELRARLAGRLEALRAQLAAMADLPAGEPLPPWSDDPPPAAWPRPARALHRAAGELHRVAGELRAASLAALDPEAPHLAPRVGEDAAGNAGTIAPEPSADQPERRPSPSTRRAIQAATVTAVSLVVGQAVSSTHQYWATLSAYQVLGETDGETFAKGGRRVAGTVVGAVVGFAIALGALTNLAVVLPLVALAVFAQTYLRPVAPAAATFWTTMIFALLYEYLGHLSTVALGYRVLETLFGAGIAVLAAFLVLPTHTRAALKDDFAAVTDDVGAIVGASLATFDGAGSDQWPAIRERLLLLDQHVRDIDTTAAPLRRSAGALEVGGIESLLTAVWTLANHTRALARATHVALEAGAGPADADWSELRRATGANVAALTAVLRGRLPGRSSRTSPTSRPGLGPPPLRRARCCRRSVGSTRPSWPCSTWSRRAP